MPSSTLSVAQQEAIVKLCEEHEKKERSRPGFRRCVVLDTFFIKYDYHDSLYPQYKTQQYVYEKAASDDSVPRVPEVYDYFTSEHEMAYLVMEYIDADPISSRSAPQEVANALQWLRCLPAPDDLMIGSVGGGRARHQIFKNTTAPLPFSSVEALERYVNKALEWIPPRSRPAKISFVGESLVFTQSDPDESNFFIDTNGKMCMVDFEDVGLLPESFASYTVHLHCNSFVVEVAKYLNWSRSSNLYSMARAGAILHTISDITLGLDKDGWLRVRH